MKTKIGLLALMSVFTLLPIPILAANNSGNNQAQLSATQTPSGQQVQNRNRQTTQNQGEIDQVQTQAQNQEREGYDQGQGTQNRNQNAVQNMSEVAKQVQLLLQSKTTGGIGNEVRQVAQQQNDAQAQIQNNLNKLDSKGRLARFFTGTDTQAVQDLKTVLAQNQSRIEQLTALQTKLVNKAESSQVQATIEAILQENLSLQERINAEEKVRGLFGWFYSLFNR